MKRKRSPSESDSISRKRLTNGATDKATRPPCRLIRILSQYGILDSIAPHILPKDLYALAATSKAAYKAIFLRKESRSCLLRKMRCDGSGIRIRQLHHQKSKYFYQYNCSETVTCGSSELSRLTRHDSAQSPSPFDIPQPAPNPTTALNRQCIFSERRQHSRIEADRASLSSATSGPNSNVRLESRPCVSCSKMTCNECRIHCVYQSIIQPVEDPDDSEEQPNLSGFALLHPHEMGILSPQHFANSEVINELGHIPWDPPFHDQGILDMPLNESIPATPENILDIITTNLGQQSLDEIQASGPSRPSSIVRPFYEVTEQRKRYMCADCSPFTNATHHCDCTLEKRFLDRWLCLSCYTKERDQDSRQSNRTRDGPPKHCSCEKRLSKAKTVVQCLWCNGQVNSRDRSTTLH